MLTPPVIIKKGNIDDLNSTTKTIKKISKRLFKLKDLIKKINKKGYIDGFEAGLKKAQ